MLEERNFLPLFAFFGSLLITLSFEFFMSHIKFRLGTVFIQKYLFT